MGTYDAGEWLETFGGLPEPGEAYPADPDAVRDAYEEAQRELRAGQPDVPVSETTTNGD